MASQHVNLNRFHIRQTSSRHQWLFWRDLGGLISLLFLLVLIVGALTAAWLTPYMAEGQGTPNIAHKLIAPSLTHPFGTDEMGRDLLARLLYGGRYSLSLAGLVIGGSLVIGIPVGLLSGYAGGWFDEVAMRLTDIFLAFPPLLLAILLVTILGGGLGSTVLALLLSWWPWYARLMRGQVMALCQRPFVDAARCVGARPLHILVRHLLPNALIPVLVQATIDFGAVILTAAGLSFIGLGALPPAADWGMMLAHGRALLLSGYWWTSTFPGLAITLTGLACALVGDWLRGATNVASTHAHH